jgi:hypothetical protein
MLLTFLKDVSEEIPFSAICPALRFYTAKTHKRHPRAFGESGSRVGHGDQKLADTFADVMPGRLEVARRPLSPTGILHGFHAVWLQSGHQLFLLAIRNAPIAARRRIRAKARPRRGNQIGGLDQVWIVEAQNG